MTRPRAANERETGVQFRAGVEIYLFTGFLLGQGRSRSLVMGMDSSSSHYGVKQRGTIPPLSDTYSSCGA